MLKKLAILGLGASLALVTSSAITWGDSGGGDSGAKLPSKAESFKLRTGHPVPSPSVQGAGKAKKPRLKYFETNPFPIPANGREDAFMKCPRKYKVINGYFGTDGGIFPDYSAVARSIRRWNFGLNDESGLPGQAFLGIVCLKGTKG